MGSFVVEKTRSGWRVISEPLLMGLVVTKHSISKVALKDGEAEILKKRLKEVESTFKKLEKQLFHNTYGPEKKTLLNYPEPHKCFADLSDSLELGLSYMLNSYGCEVRQRKGETLIGLGQRMRVLAIYFLLEFKEKKIATEFSDVSNVYSDPLIDFELRAPKGSLRLIPKQEEGAAIRAMSLLLKKNMMNRI